VIFDSNAIVLEKDPELPEYVELGGPGIGRTDSGRELCYRRETIEGYVGI
jgi:hypothetical protein